MLASSICGVLIVTATIALQPPAATAKPAELTTEAIKRLSLRSIGPCFTPGRVGDVVVDPKNRSIWYVGLASGGVWKTTNRGTTWKPLFDEQGSYSIGCLAIDPKNSEVIWVGTGENQSQRSVSFGDGIYRSADGGSTWQNMGLMKSEHIAKILIDPRYSDVLYVAAQGPLWAAGGDRGLFKTTDNGKSWKPVLSVSENTGVTDVCFDPRDPDVLYAATYQRRRHVGVLIGGGPEAGIHKSADGGKTWTKLTDGLPTENMGRIALAVSPQKPDVIYAHVQTTQTQKDRGGFYRSEDAGKKWVKTGATQIQDGQYYGEIYADPHQFDRVYIMDMMVQVTDDGGKIFRRLNWNVHPDHHALVIDPTDANHLISGNDGGLYESHDGGKAWRHFDTLPSGQYYRITTDQAAPFYNVYGGTQDNGTHGGPARSKNRVGVRTSDWSNVGGGDGMQPRVDPTDPEIVYTQSQNAALVRTDRRTGVNRFIRPADNKIRWHWDTPLLISPHNSNRIYLAGNKLFRSENRGDNWTAISPDISRNLDPMKQEVMGKIWGTDAVSQNTFTTPLSCATSLDESPLQEGLLYIGTDDGLLQVSADGGLNWRAIDTFPGIPESAYISDVFASRQNVNTVYVAWNNYQRGDFKPYLLKSTDRGMTWVNLVGNLPARHCIWSLVEDSVNPDLLFVGTEFGLYITVDGEMKWAKVSGAPTTQFRDLEVQHREGDLVCGTFGRGVFILDDYAALRSLTPKARAKDAFLLPMRKTLAFAELPFTRAAGEFAAPNPPPGALITYHLRVPMEEKIVVIVTDSEGKKVAELPAANTAGLHRINWDLRTTNAAAAATAASAAGGGGGREGRSGSISKPGKYNLQLAKLSGGKPAPLGEPQTLELVPLPETSSVTKP
jgi:photosystem II stability/assembly factor-like uncharacterized protein